MEITFCSIWLRFSHNVGEIIESNFVISQKSIGHLVRTLEVKLGKLLALLNNEIYKRELRRMLLVQDPQVKPSVL